MRQIYKTKRQRFAERLTFDHLLQLWFNFHLVFFNYLIGDGLKLRAFNFFLKIKQGLKSYEDFDPSFIFLLCLIKITPSLYIRDIKKGGNVFQVPVPAPYWKKIALSCSWVVKVFKRIDNKVFTIDKIVETLFLALSNEGLAMEEKHLLYQVASINRHLLFNRIFLR